MILVCDCGQETTIASLLDSTEFFESHGHYPSMMKLVCVCGSSHYTGPSERMDPGTRAMRDLWWFDRHKNCGTFVRGGNQSR